MEGQTRLYSIFYVYCRKLGRIPVYEPTKRDVNMSTHPILVKMLWSDR